MTIRLGINGFGRIGRCTLAHIAEAGLNEVEVVKINATGPIETNAHLLKYDSVHGRFGGTVRVEGDTMDLGHGPIKVMSTYDPQELDWEGVDVVLECTGKFNDGLKSAVHLERGARKVLISAPATNVARTVVFGVNHRDILAEDRIISNGSCTTNCLAPLAKVLNDAIGIESGIMTTIHSYTGDQSTHDRRHKDLYRARAASMALIPTSTGAAKALGLVLPELAGKLDGTSIRVPTPNVSAVDLTFQASKDVTVADVNEVVRQAAAGHMGAVLGYDPEPKVSIDFNHTTESSIFAPDQTKVVGRTVRVLAWYDNEWGFSARMADVAAAMGRLH
ncbi:MULTISPECIES: type I glyceraldehyde-3-phosphate dehydrogenase [Roseobacteraceae]|jgi:glyceraldehyde 3-phosphate dehydrogenase|uniref:Glyceraldehyde-3-phosphate dehydrogenase n=2 Tax=Celeribacter baekdonensis TaxID=875171 RepID=K2K5Z5_9RHOB|nr:MULTISPECIES: type I glyceraldehyde-3-phosphate dehydrogenase [Roseobacteraceae]MBU1278521.1 type I glyceraldehyde-3-phosphate dehydrogenase [Alphaproteobacteria bacterium]EKE72885.1 glyceraldehyde-3-phosphate dehydrogenase [Celeribacter baekdonensis B30]KAB6717870.1 type I glyceraldehyde-3-phosphate dehydrogenase [Roseobacter sp. TSBP12]MBU1571876.1 type I glyceraldehyde-3-phosphate dehydrogenase [Alphaproteobacteria bacterium]MBU2079887.1 type I glyceraldehyde-3-phosphate dehydrogenase [A|tara:strand:+ start:6648 stop:7646 length:999 start_codon:yes stop_codon:yes gene_type:complete